MIKTKYEQPHTFSYRPLTFSIRNLTGHAHAKVYGKVTGQASTYDGHALIFTGHSPPASGIAPATHFLPRIQGSTQ